MKKVLFLQFRTDFSLEHEREQVLKNTKFKKNEINFLNVANSASQLPEIKDLEKFSGLIIGGSAQFDLTTLDQKLKDRVDYIRPLIKYAIVKDYPTLGLCFGHHLICQIMGSKVKKDKVHAESGIAKYKLTKSGKVSPLYKDFPETFEAVTAHKESVLTPPTGGKLISTNKVGKYQSFQFGNNVFSVQYHPEIDKEGLIYRIAFFPEYLKQSGKTLDELKKETHDVPHAHKVIDNFRKIIKQAE